MWHFLLWLRCTMHGKMNMTQLNHYRWSTLIITYYQKAQTMTIVFVPCSQTILQKSSEVCSSGPWVAIYALSFW